MPGRLMMSSSSANGAGGTLNGKIPQVESGEVDEPVGATTGVTNGDALPKGDVQKPPLPVQVAQPSVNGVSALSPRSSMSDLPPEIVQITEGYEPFGKLIARVVQECSNELNEVVDKLSSIAVPPPLTNGVSHVNGSGNMSQQNLHKKMAWLEFANSNREQFIKLMVISQWSRNADQVKKLIDLMFWSNGQTECYQRASDGLGELKRSLHSFKSPNPDIKTALEVLSTGKASWMPDLDYIPLEPLTPEELLRTIKSMNALLSMRLNLHEDLPIHLRNWKIKNGRATFTFPLEFEFDVTIANEDPTRQLYFVDIRFLFQPSAEVPEGQIRDVLQFKADEALLNSKIPGCAEFLRNFALTHQITTLRKQAVSMLQSTWTSAIRIEPIHRSLIIQYWTETSFPKSWIEIGIDSGVGKKRLRPGHVELPLIRARWKRYGVDVKDTELDLRLSNISMEQILKRAIAAHSIEVLRTAKDELQKSSSGSQLLRMELQESEDEPIDCMLKLQLGRFSPQITFAIEPISGQLCLQPSTIISRQAEWVLNSVKNPLAEVHEKLHTYLCLDMLWRIERQAQHADWHQVPSWRFDENYVKARFKCEVRRHGFFRPRGWANSEPNWAVAVTIELDGEKWWVVEVAITSEGHSITAVQELPLLTPMAGECPFDDTLFRKLDHAAVRAILWYTTVRDFKSKRIPNDIRYAETDRGLINAKKFTPLDPELDVAGRPVPTLCLQFSTLLPVCRAPSQPIAEILQLSYLGFDESKSKAQVAVKGALTQSAGLEDMLVALSAHDPTLLFNRQGIFIMLIESQLGESLMATLIFRLRVLIHLLSLLRVLKDNKITPTEASLTSVAFTYSSSPSPPLSCRLTLPVLHTDSVAVSLSLAATNPHQRIRAHLQDSLNASLATFMRALPMTLPIVHALKGIETYGYANIRTHNMLHYRLAYRTVPTVFDIRIRTRRDNFEWWIFELPPPGSQSHPQQGQGQHGQQPQAQLAVRPPGYEESIREWMVSSGEGYRGLRSGMICTSTGIQAAVAELDQRIRDILVAREASRPALHGGASVSSNGSPVGTRRPSKKAAKAVNGGLAAGRSGGAAGMKKGADADRSDVIMLD